jgi:SAM-dependent methyltransferase
MTETTFKTNISCIESWVTSILADPVTKMPVKPKAFSSNHGVLDARVFLKNTYGYSTWAEGQDEYESWACQDSTPAAGYHAEIEFDRPIYTHFCLDGRILDCGGGAGTVRQFLPEEVEFVSVDPWIHASTSYSDERKQAYTCLNQSLNFMAATAEFLPFVGDSFDWVHMRSMLDHVQVVDLALLEARRVLRVGGKVLIGLYVEGGKTGVIPISRRFKNLVKSCFEAVGSDRWKDHHVWHPTYSKLIQLITDNGFEIEDTYWQPQWKDTVCYVCARKPN